MGKAPAEKPDKAMVLFHYVNHAGKAAERRVVPVKIWFGSTAWHPYPQWLLEAVDVDKGALRDFAMSAVSNWRAADAADIETQGRDSGGTGPEVSGGSSGDPHCR